MKFLLLLLLAGGLAALGYWHYRSARETAREWVAKVERLVQ